MDKLDAGEGIALSHGQLMALLQQLYSRPGDAGERIASRFKSLQKVGLPAGPKPRRGKRDKYSLLQICEVVMCIEFAQFGMDAWYLADHFYAGTPPFPLFEPGQLLVKFMEELHEWNSFFFDSDKTDCVAFTANSLTIKPNEKTHFYMGNYGDDYFEEHIFGEMSVCVLSLRTIAIRMIRCWPKDYLSQLSPALHKSLYP